MTPAKRPSTRARRTPIQSLDDLQPDPLNANRGTDRGREALRRSLRTYGAGRSIVIDTRGRILGGGGIRQWNRPSTWAVPWYQDYVEASRWYHPAAEQGYVKAQFNLGLMHGKGQGVHQNYVEAHMWFGLTAAQAPADVRDRYVNVRDGVAQEMTREQIAEGDRRASEWKPIDQNQPNESDPVLPT